MKKLELVVYNLVRDNPKLRRFIRDSYQRLCDLRPTPDQDSAAEIHARPGCFFGFHDKSPFSGDDTLLLAHRETIPLRMPEAVDRVDIGVFNGVDWSQFEPLASSRAWNWHQGAMLQWLGVSKRFIFNDYDGQNSVARIHDVDSGHVGTLDMPISAISRDGSLAACYNMARADHGMPGYGYVNARDPEQGERRPKTHGLSIMNIDSGQAELLYSVDEIARISPEASMDGKFHWITHCQFSPSGKRMKFFHRWRDDDHARWTRMFSCAVDGSDLHLFPSSRKVSHVGWRDDEQLAAYARTDADGEGYYLYNDLSTEYKRIGKDTLSSDGHMSFSTDGRWMLTDTYPDRFRRQTLILFDVERSVRYDLARLRLDKKFVGPKIEHHWTVDLHPRWSRDCRTICFDSAYSGTRSLCTLPVGALDQDAEPRALEIRRDSASS